MANDEKIYGLHAVKMILESRPRDVLRLSLQVGRDDQRMEEIIQLADQKNIKYEHVSKTQIEKIVGENVNHQGVVAYCRPMTPWTEKNLMEFVEKKSGSVLLLILDGVQDPHNLGACLRSANGFGVDAVIAPKDRAVGLTDVVRKVACGAAECTPFIAVANLHRTLQQLQKLNVWLVGLDSDASLSLSQVNFSGSVAVVMGGEGDGMRRLTKETCDYLAKIPMQGNVESLNVSVATGVALYEVQRQRAKSVK